MTYADDLDMPAEDEELDLDGDFDEDEDDLELADDFDEDEYDFGEDELEGEEGDDTDGE